MGVLTPKRVVLFVIAVLLGTSAFAKQPSPRTLARMAWDVPNNVGVLFGGRGAFDGATGVTHGSDETWLWNGSRWVERFPRTVPPGRSAHTMVFDSARGRVVMFGGRQEPADRNAEATFLNDTWAWKDDNWTKIESAENPSPRHFVGMAYDSDRDRIILYGGNEYAADGTTVQQDHETWEFDGSQWTKIAEEPKVAKPLLAYDPVLKKVIMVGLNETGLSRVMYAYDPASQTWSQYPTTTTFPTCVNEGHMMYQEHRGRLAFFGGICTIDTPAGQEVFEFDGTNWVKLEGNTTVRTVGEASAYDPLRNQMVTFGGTLAFSATIGSITTVIRDAQWSSPFFTQKPSPRSLATFTTDPESNTVWMFGGLDENSAFYYGDLWGLRNGQWYLMPEDANSPGGGCETPLAAFDSDRKVLVVTCSGTETYEFNGTTWSAKDPQNDPPIRRFGAMVYDKRLKKTLIFGGYNNSNYRNDTWSWDGTNWTEIKIDGDDRPTNRGLMAMWYDPLQQKTIIYGGLGRGSVNEKITRYSDMWSFDGTRWTKMSVSTTPGERFGPQYAVDPNTGKLLLFGGLRSENIDEDSLRQFFVNDTWQWDGAAGTWTRLEPTRVPSVRENGSMAWDPVAGRLVLFAGYANGFYRSDVWTWTGTDWEPFVEVGLRRRAVR